MATMKQQHVSEVVAESPNSKAAAAATKHGNKGLCIELDQLDCC